MPNAFVVVVVMAAEAGRRVPTTGLPLREVMVAVPVIEIMVVEMMAMVVMIMMVIAVIVMREMVVPERAVMTTMTAAARHRVGRRHGDADRCNSGEEFAQNHHASI
jgi:hypothetical protein